MTIVENEQLEVVGEGDGDGWLKARNYRGEEGYVPHNYLDVEREQTPATHGLTNQISFSSVDYTIENEEPTTAIAEERTPPPVEPQAPREQPPPQAEHKKEYSYCCALYDYDGEGEEELSFEEGQIIKVLSKCAHSVDDGWWRGELDGQTGNFPSLVVEECDEFGEPLTNEWDETPPCSAPPVFTPPEIPEFLVSSDETAATVDQNGTAEIEGTHQSKRSGFEMEMSPIQHEQYGTQFGHGGIPSKFLIHNPSYSINR